MGSFEKLGILVIVVIIVMILAVAIYQWGATGVEPIPDTVAIIDRPETLIVDFDEPLKGPEADGGGRRGRPATLDEAKNWAGGIPRQYVIRDRDILWNLVVKTWRLRESFIDAIKKANPRVDDVAQLKAGDRLVIPDPAAYRRTAKKGKAKAQKGDHRVYEIQEGDTLELISRNHLGTKTRWKEIQRLNPGLKPENMQLGTKILIPLK